MKPKHKVNGGHGATLCYKCNATIDYHGLNDHLLCPKCQSSLLSKVKKYIFIEVDTNDGDYISTLTEIDENTIEAILPIIKAIEKNNGEFTCGEMGNSGEELYGNFENFNVFEDYCPCGEYGFHTIETIQIFETLSIKNLL